MAQIDFIAKDFQSIVDSLITFATSNFGADTSANRQWTNFNISDFSRTWLEIVSFTGDLLFFYMDNHATQSVLETAFVRSAILNIGKQMDFIADSVTAATDVAQFTVSRSITIAEGFKLRANNNTNWFTLTTKTSAGAGTLDIEVSEGERFTETFTALGIQNEEFTLTNATVAVDVTSTFALLRSPVVTVGATTFTKVDSFLSSSTTDNHFQLLTNPDGTSKIRFGDGIFGKQTTAGNTITVTYRTSLGAVGNIAADTLTTLVDSIDGVDSVTNQNNAGGGADEPSISRLKEQIPASIKTLERAVTVSDFADLVLANFNQVLKAQAEENVTEIATDVNLYLVPSGSSITQITDNTALQNDIESFLDARKLITSSFSIKNAFGLDILVKVEAFLTQNASRTVVDAAIKTALTDFFNLNTGDVDGSGTKFAQKIELNEIYKLIRTIEGVERFEIKKFTYRPRVEENIGISSNYLFTEVQIFPDIQKREWLLGLDADNQFSVFKKLVGIISSISTNSVADTSLNLTEASGTGEIDISISNLLFDTSQSFVPDQFTGAQATGTFTAGSSAGSVTILDGNFVTLPDGLGNVITFEFDTDSSVTETDSLRQVDISSATDDTDVRDAFRAAVNLAPSLNITATDSGSFDAILTNDFTGSHGNAQTSSLLAVGASITDMTDGQRGFVLKDSNGNVFSILNHDSHTFSLSATRLNDSAATDVAAGSYLIVENFAGAVLILNGTIIDNLIFNTENTFFTSSLAFVDSFGIPGDVFFISQEQLGKIDEPQDINGSTFQIDSAINSGGRTDITFNTTIPILSIVSSDISASSHIDVEWVFIQEISGIVEIFEIAATNGTTEITILHSGTPTITTGIGATAIIAKRYFDDDRTISIAIGFTDSATITPAATGDANDVGTDVNGDRVDNFVFRTSPIVDDIVNIRNNEIPEISELDIITDLRGGI